MRLKRTRRSFPSSVLMHKPAIVIDPPSFTNAQVERGKTRSRCSCSTKGKGIEAFHHHHHHQQSHMMMEKDLNAEIQALTLPHDSESYKPPIPSFPNHLLLSSLSPTQPHRWPFTLTVGHSVRLYSTEAPGWEKGCKILRTIIIEKGIFLVRLGVNKHGFV